MPQVSLLIKPASGNCNMRCKYCFYIDEMENRSVKNMGIMSESTLYSMFRNVFDYAEQKCNIAFQGGEPTLAGLDYFYNVVKVVNELNVNQCEINYAIQTNGYDLDEEWIRFFKDNKFLVGISLDGTKEVHDKYRVDASNRGTFDKVMECIDLLKKYEVDFNILTTVHADTVPKVNQIYNFYKRNDLDYQQYIECLDPIGEIQGGQEYSLTPEMYGDFLIALFKKFYRDIKAGKYTYIRYFENLIGIMMNEIPENCAMSGRCRSYLTVESDGSVYPCDFYVLDQWKLGNITTDSVEMINKRRLELKFVECSHEIPTKCRLCKWFSLCRNGCRRNCEPSTLEKRQVNYFCEGYNKFFEYAIPYLEELCELYKG